MKKLVLILAVSAVLGIIGVSYAGSGACTIIGCGCTSFSPDTSTLANICSNNCGHHYTSHR